MSECVHKTCWAHTQAILFMQLGYCCSSSPHSSSLCREKQMAYFKMAVVCVDRWMDPWESPIFIYLFYILSSSHNLYLSLSLCTLSRSISGVCGFSTICLQYFFLRVFSLIHPSANEAQWAIVQWLGRSVGSVVMRASLVWLGDSSVIS